MPPDPYSAGALPSGLQILASIGIVLGAAVAAFFGYKKRLDREPPGAAATLVASFPDMSAVRSLTDICRLLYAEVEKLESSVRDQTHYMRDSNDIGRELCSRLRELKEEIVRQNR